MLRNYHNEATPRHFYISGRLAVQVAMLGAAAAMFAIYLVSGEYISRWGQIFL